MKYFDKHIVFPVLIFLLKQDDGVGHIERLLLQYVHGASMLQ